MAFKKGLEQKKAAAEKASSKLIDGSGAAVSRGRRAPGRGAPIVGRGGRGDARRGGPRRGGTSRGRGRGGHK